MNALENLTINRRLNLGFGILLLMLIVLTILGIQKVNFISHSLTEMTDVNSVKQRFAINYRGSVHDRAIAVRDVSLSTSESQLETFVQEIKSLEDFYVESEVAMQTMRDQGIAFTSEEINILSDIDQVKRTTIPIVQKIIEHRRNGEIQNAKDLVMNDARPAFAQWLSAINAFIDFQEKQNRTTTQLARGAADGFQEIMIIITAIATIIGFFIARLIVKSLHKSLGGEPAVAQSTLSEIAQGNLAINVSTKYSGSMLGSLAQMQSKLSETVSQIFSASEKMSLQTQNVSSSSQTANDAAETQAVLTQTTTERLAVMRQQLIDVSEIAEQTEANSIQTTEYSKNGKEATSRSAEEMHRIAETVNTTVAQIKKLDATTQEIGSIVNVISSISEQTNLLALNAAIEAARAGESGRGFAVVADEVRQLAKRTGDATNQIETIISEVQKETAASVSAMEKTQPLVESGQSLTSQTHQLLVQIERQAQASLSNVQNVSSATSQQVDTIKELTEAMQEISLGSSSSIDALHRNMSAIAELDNLSEELKRSVGFFRLSPVAATG